MRVAHVNMSQSGASCPQGLTQKNMSGLTLCGQNADGCQGAFFSALGLNYSQVCGQLRGYQFSTTDAFAPYFYQRYNVSEAYVDGASITYDTAEPKHIWTYATGNSERGTGVKSCPCNINSTTQPHQVPPPFVGNDYYCESGNSNGYNTRNFFADDPLWDGQQCEDSCCSMHPNMPWFTKTLNGTTTEDIQLRLCVSSGTADEETLLQLITLYVY